MWAKINAAEVRQTNVVNLMQIDMLSLGVLQTQMENLTTQSTIIIGFALGMLGGATLFPLVDDQSQVCIYKSWYSQLFAVLFFLSVALCISSCVVLVVITSYVKQATQGAALVVSTGAAVAQTRVHVAQLSDYFIVAIVTFTTSAGMLFILYIGMPKRIELSNRLVEIHGHYSYLPCLDSEDPDTPSFVTNFGAGLAGMNSFVLLAMAAFLTFKFRAVRSAHSLSHESYTRHACPARLRYRAAQAACKPRINRSAHRPRTGARRNHHLPNMAGAPLVPSRESARLVREAPGGAAR
jgi:hypothetical protein